MVSERDIETVAWSSSDSGGAIARESGAKNVQRVSFTLRSVHINTGAGEAAPS